MHLGAGFVVLFRLLFSGRREMLQQSKGQVESGLFLLIAKSQWTGTKLVSKVNHAESNYSRFIDTIHSKTEESTQQIKH